MGRTKKVTATEVEVPEVETEVKEEAEEKDTTLSDPLVGSQVQVGGQMITVAEERVVEVNGRPMLELIDTNGVGYRGQYVLDGALV